MRIKAVNRHSADLSTNGPIITNPVNSFMMVRICWLPSIVKACFTKDLYLPHHLDEKYVNSFFCVVQRSKILFITFNTSCDMFFKEL